MLESSVVGFTSVCCSDNLQEGNTEFLLVVFLLMIKLVGSCWRVICVLNAYTNVNYLGNEVYEKYL